MTMQPITSASGASDPTTWRSRPGIGEECAAAIIEAAAVDEQRLVAIIERRPLDVVLVQVQLGNALGEPVEQFEAVGVGTIHCPQSERCSGRNGGSPTPATRRLRGRSRR
jgi:hypothetical protein